MILASSSPRRRELLQQAGFELTIEPSDIDETRLPNESPTALVERLARMKAMAALRNRGGLGKDNMLLGADTVVWMGNEVLGKPKSKLDAMRMLGELSNKTHHVSTGVCLITNDGNGTNTRSFVETTDVTFRKLSDEEIAAYVATDEPMDKAGAYAIQGGARAFVSSYEGDYDNVVGLPVSRVLAIMRATRECVPPS